MKINFIPEFLVSLVIWHTFILMTTKTYEFETHAVFGLYRHVTEGGFICGPLFQQLIHIEGLDKIMETLRNWGIVFVLAILKELQLATLNVFFRL
jgi:hypothetical protein